MSQLIIYNPLPEALRHYTLELTASLPPETDVRVVETANEGLRGLAKLGALVLHVRTTRRLLRGDSEVIVVWPLLGWYELWLLARRKQGVALVVHDPRPLTDQVGLQEKAASRVSRVRRGWPTVLSHSNLAAEETRKLVPHASIATVPHPVMKRGMSRPLRAPEEPPTIAVFGQFKEARDTDLLERLGTRFRGLGVRAVIRGRGWPTIAGWDVEDRFLAEDELDDLMAAATAVLIPYRYYFQSGIAVRAVEIGVPVIGARHPFLEELLGNQYTGLVDDESDEGWADAVTRIISEPPAASESAEKIASKWRDFVRSGLGH